MDVCQIHYRHLQAAQTIVRSGVVAVAVTKGYLFHRLHFSGPLIHPVRYHWLRNDRCMSYEIQGGGSLLNRRESSGQGQAASVSGAKESK